MSKYRKGSMGAADEKNEKIFNAAFTIILLAIVCITVFPSGTFFHDYFKAAGIAWKVIGLTLLPIWGWLAWFYLPDANWSGTTKNITMFGGIALIMLCLFGFNLSL